MLNEIINVKYTEFGIFNPIEFDRVSSKVVKFDHFKQGGEFYPL